MGSEGSKQKIIWVLRRADTGDIFTGDGGELQLPKGYRERVKNRGIVVNFWAPQLEILVHPSVGEFMSHPIAVWPMHSDQPRNTVIVTDVLRTGVLVRD